MRSIRRQELATLRRVLSQHNHPLGCVAGDLSTGVGSELRQQSEDRITVLENIFVVIEFMRSPEWFLECIVYCSALSKHRDSMLTVGRPCVFSEGVKLLVRPEVVNDALFLSPQQSPGSI